MLILYPSIQLTCVFPAREMILFCWILDAEDQSRFSKPVLFIINPASGKGMGRRWFKEKVVPMLQEAYIEFESIETGK